MVPSRFSFLRLSAFFIICSFSAVAIAGPGLIQYQGRLTNSAGNPITATVNVTFTFWSAAAGGSQLGGFIDADTVTPNAQGLYSTMIGDDPGTKIPDSIFTSPQVWLNVNVGGENLSPRKQMVATGYAFQSNWATTATTALASKDTLATVTSRGASTSKELTLSGGVKTAKISPLGAGGSVQVEGVYMIGGGIKLPDISHPSDPTSRVYQSNGALFYGGIPVMLKQGSAYIIVQTTADPVVNGANLVSTYNTAKTLKPHGQDLATSNRLTVLIPPGRYDISASQLLINSNYIDLVGVSTSRSDQFIYGKITGFGNTLIRQTANDVHIENLFMECSCPTYYSYPPGAYRPDNDTTNTIIRNCEFVGKDRAISINIHTNFSGYYENCTAGDDAFGYMEPVKGTFVNCKAGRMSFGYNGDASGTFIDCTAGDDSFGAVGKASGTFTRCTGKFASFGNRGVASGTFTDCVGGNQSFAKEGTASGTFTRCKAGNDSFGYQGTASGSFTDCVGGTQSFGAVGTANGTFDRCKADAYSFGYRGTAGGTFRNCIAGESSYGTYGTASGKFTHCTGTDFCFGFAATASGTFTGCTAAAYSFGTGDYDKASIVSGTFTNCVGQGCCFGASGGAGGMTTTCSGTFTNCVGGGHSFGGQHAVNTSARLKDCTMTESIWWGTWAGQMENCRWATGFNCVASARIYNSTILGTVNLDNYAAGMTQSRAKSIMNANNNVFGATNAAAFNLASLSVQ